MSDLGLLFIALAIYFGLTRIADAYRDSYVEEDKPELFVQKNDD